jgi:GntR family transcriptional regulator
LLTFRLDRDSGIPAYLQIANQVREAIRFGWVLPGEQVPTVKDVAATSGLNPNTVLRAYRDLAADGVLEIRQGAGTFVAERSAGTDPHLLTLWRTRLVRWVRGARDAGLSDDDIVALLRSVDIESPIALGGTS